jgi:hypothetical protein
MSEPEWKPISSAPMDGTKFLALSTHEDMGGNFQQVVFYDISDSKDPAYCWWVVDARVARHESVFNYWMPLPAAPKQDDAP